MDGFGLQNNFATYLILEVQVTFGGREKDSVQQQKCTSHLTDFRDLALRCSGTIHYPYGN